MKKGYRWIIGFAVFLLVITYLSRTIYAWTLPRVTLCFSSNEAFTRTFYDSDTVQFTDDYDGYTATSVFFISAEDMPPSNSSGWTEASESALMINLNIPKYSGMRFSGKAVDYAADTDGSYITVAYTPTRNAAAADLPAEVEEGDAITVEFIIPTANHDFIVPSSAVHRDIYGDYIMRVTTRDTAMGREFITVREDVMVWSVFQGKTLLIGSDVSGLPIVEYADREVAPDHAVRFYP